MILPGLMLPTRAGVTEFYSGIDSPEHAADPHYPHAVSYVYNSRGFRDAEWPCDPAGAVWCMGDSFTVGIGVPYDHIWPQRLAKRINARTINVSLDGGSNDWIARRAQEILQTVQPRAMVIQWTFVHRREYSPEQIHEQRWQQFYSKVKDPGWPTVAYCEIYQLPKHVLEELNSLHNFSAENIESVCDEQRRAHFVGHTDQQDRENLLGCIKAVERSAGATHLVHSFVPDFATPQIQQEFFQCVNALNYVKPFTVLDRGRDQFHYDILTADHFAGCVADQLLNWPS